jgi:heme-degrading monooxygenase HmoA
MYTILWEFRVPPERCARFEAAYAADGPWAQLFARSEGFIAVELLRGTESAGRYVTVDRWRSRAHFAQFKNTFAKEYSALDRELDGIADGETRLGVFETLALD